MRATRALASLGLCALLVALTFAGTAAGFDVTGNEETIEPTSRTNVPSYMPMVPPVQEQIFLDRIAVSQYALAAELLGTMDPAKSWDQDPVLRAAVIGVQHRQGLVGLMLPASTLPGLSQQHENLDAAGDLLAQLQQTHSGDGLERSVALAKESTRVQAHTMGLPWLDAPASPAHPPPAEAFSTLLGAPALLSTTEALPGLNRLDALPNPVARALTDTVSAFVTFESAVDRAYADTDPALLRDTTSIQDPAAGPDLVHVFPARNALLDAVVGLARALDEHPVPAGGLCAPVQLPPSFSIDLSQCDNTYTQDFALLIDAGGDDTYHNNAGGSALNGGDCPLAGPIGGAATLIDLGGDDEYGDAAAPRGCGANGGGALGAGVLVDGGGNDTFHASGFGTNGGGNFGAGLLISAGGNDVYSGTTFGVNGGSEGGAGMLIDLAGDDMFLASSRGTNGGSFGGSGFLLDGFGSDLYQAGSAATNGGAAASGAGFLLDATGDDHYSGGNGGTNGGGAGTQSVGFLLDGAGDDRFHAGADGTNGGGAAIGGVGMLVALSGADEFVANERGTNGGAHGYGAAGFLFSGVGNTTYQGGHSGANGGARQGAVALLFDAGGDDYYFHVAPPNPPHPPFQGSFGTNGGAYMGAVAALIDGGGDDVYEGGRSGVNGGGWRTGIAAGVLLDAVGLLFDADGTDYYEDRDLLVPGIFGSCWDCSLFPKGNSHGAQVDSPNLP